MNRCFHHSVALVAALAVLGTAGVAGSAAGAEPQAAVFKAKTTAVDRAFVREMVPHHQMAVQMARMAEMQAKHAEIKATAEDIVTAQNREIRQLRKIASRLGVKPAGMDDHERMMRDADTLGLTMDETGMSMDMDELDGAKPFDRAFIDMMVPHHQGAIRMARAELAKGRNGDLRTIARAIVTAQAKEIRQLNAWRKQWYGAPSPAGGVPKA